MSNRDLKLPDLISNLLENGTLEVVGSKYKCSCSDNGTLLRSSIRKHVETKKHLAWVNFGNGRDNPVAQEGNNIIADGIQECHICFELRKKFRKCNTCGHDVCLACKTRIHRCPFCRSLYQVRPKRKVHVSPDYGANYEADLAVAIAASLR